MGKHHDQPRLPRGSGLSRAASYKASQRARIAEQFGIDELRRRRTEEQITVRLLQCLCIPVKRTRFLLLNLKADMKVVKPRRADHPFYAVSAPESSAHRRATSRVFYRAAAGAQFNEFSIDDQSLYARALWNRIWWLSHVMPLLSNRVHQQYLNHVRRRLLRVAGLVLQDPALAVRRILLICLLPPDKYTSRNSFYLALTFLGVCIPFYCHLRASGFRFPELERHYGDGTRFMGTLPDPDPPHATYRLAFAVFGLLAERSVLGVAGLSEAEAVAMGMAQARDLNIVPQSDNCVNEQGFKTWPPDIQSLRLPSAEVTAETEVRDGN